MAEPEHSAFPSSPDAHVAFLKTRYDAGLAFTSVTPNVLISITPPRSAPASYAASVLPSASPPLDHLCGVAERAYQCAMTERSSVVVALTGESGSGKTRNAAVLIEYLARRGGSGPATEQLASLLAHANVVLEAFGCADVGPTCGQASRFERATSVLIGSDGRAVGASVTTFGLEYSRLLSERRAPAERSFAIFYQLLAGASTQQLRDLGLLASDATFASAQDFVVTRYARTVDHITAPLSSEPLLALLRSADSYLSLLPRELLTQCVAQVSDSIGYSRTLAAMEVLGIPEAERWEAMRVVAAILLLGNASFRAAGEGSAAGDPTVLCAAARLLGLPNDSALELQKLMLSRNNYTVPLNKERAQATCNLLMQNLYVRLFGWLVQRINAALEAPPQQSVVCVADFAGFSAQHDSLDQLLFNHATDTLHLALGKRYLVAPQEAFVRRCLPWTSFDPGLNDTVVELVSGRPLGVLQTLNEETMILKGSDATFLTKLRRAPILALVLVFDQLSADFAVRHASGLARYSPVGWVSENRFAFPDSLDSLMRDSMLSLVRERLMWLQLNGDEQPARSTRQAYRSRVDVFRDGVSALVSKVASCATYAVHCVRPNRRGLGADFDPSAVGEQLAPLHIQALLFMHTHGHSLSASPAAPEQHPS